MVASSDTGTPWILPLIASLGMRREVTQLPGSSMGDIVSLGFHYGKRKCQYFFFVTLL